MNGNPFSWPAQVREAFNRWAEKVIPADLFDVESDDYDQDPDLPALLQEARKAKPGGETQEG